MTGLKDALASVSAADMLPAYKPDAELIMMQVGKKGGREGGREGETQSVGLSCLCCCSSLE